MCIDDCNKFRLDAVVLSNHQAFVGLESFPDSTQAHFRGLNNSENVTKSQYG